MNMIFEFDWAKVSQKFIIGLHQGAITIRDDIAYWTEASGKAGIVQYMPLKKMSIASNENLKLEELVPVSYLNELTTLGISTSNAIGSIIIQTGYLSQQIENLQIILDLIAQNCKTQHILNYIERIALYIKNVESGRALLLDKKIVAETTAIAENLLTQLSIQRNETFSLIENLIRYSDKATDAHLEHMITAIALILDILPKTIYIEAQLCDRYEKFCLAEHIIQQGSYSYQQVLAKFSHWYNEKEQKSTKRNACVPITINKVMFKKKDLLNSLLSSPYNDSLLQLLQSPSSRVATVKRRI